MSGLLQFYETLRGPTPDLGHGDDALRLNATVPVEGLVGPLRATSTRRPAIPRCSNW
jgi:hypothetical protein